MKKGFNRLGIFLGIAASLVMGFNMLAGGEPVVEVAFVAVVSFLALWLGVRLFYWVFEGFTQGN